MPQGRGGVRDLHGRDSILSPREPGGVRVPSPGLWQVNSVALGEELLCLVGESIQLGRQFDVEHVSSAVRSAYARRGDNLCDHMLDMALDLANEEC